MPILKFGFKKRPLGDGAASPLVQREAATRTSEDAARLIAQGNDLEDRGNFDAALDCYRDAVATSPGFSRAHMNVANALRKLDRLDEAIASAREAVDCDPASAPARFNLGSLLAACEAPDAADLELREALRLDHQLVDARVVLAEVLETQGRSADAELELRSALRARPHFAGAALNLAQLMIRQNRLDEADEWLIRAQELEPRLVESALSALLMSFLVQDDADRDTMFRSHVQFGRLIERAVAKRFDSWTNAPVPDRPLRIGYVSGDFRNHPIAWFMRPVLEHHDPSRYEIYCYANHGTPNPEAQALAALVPHWRDISSLDDEQVAERIRADAIDILVDLSGHTKGSRLHVFVGHPAPVQATWLGYLGTTGLTSIDYRICDRYTDPEGKEDSFNTEQLFRMPNSQWCYAPWHEAAPVPEPHADTPGRIVFGSFNQHDRISDICLDQWCRVFLELPEAHLVMLDVRGEGVRQSLLDRFARRGIDLAKIVMHDRQPVPAYFETIGNVDIAFDTWPYNGATTTLNTLWMGVPVVALRGNRGISRGSYSIMRSLALPDLIAESPDEFVALNVKLARDAEWRGKLRATLRARLAASPLMDARQFTRDLEAGYRQMWRGWCELHGAPR